MARRYGYRSREEELAALERATASARAATQRRGGNAIPGEEPPEPTPEEDAILDRVAEQIAAEDAARERRRARTRR
jgi:hypothetical protein